eukprot:3376922-Rhodomonas_salina.1
MSRLRQRSGKPAMLRYAFGSGSVHSGFSEEHFWGNLWSVESASACDRAVHLRYRRVAVFVPGGRERMAGAIGE